jgi:hypothetical protein
MIDTPCGCDLRDRAEAMADARGASVLLADARDACAGWRCRHAGHEPAPLGDAQQRTLDVVRSIVGANADEITACPGSYARTPEAHEASRLMRWMRAGALALRCPHPTAAQVDAIDLAMDSLSAREAWELEQARKGRDRG